MRISTDVCWGKIIDHDTDKVLIDLRSAPQDYQKVVKAVLTDSQYLHYIEYDGVYTLSVKKQKILAEFIKKYSK